MRDWGVEIVGFTFTFARGDRQEQGDLDYITFFPVHLTPHSNAKIKVPGWEGDCVTRTPLSLEVGAWRTASLEEPYPPSPRKMGYIAEGAEARRYARRCETADTNSDWAGE